MFDFLKKDLLEYKRLNPQKKAFLILLILLLFAGSIIVGAYLSKGTSVKKAEKTTSIKKEEEVKKPPSTTLKIEPSSATIKVGKTQDISVVLSDVPVTASDIILMYDPKIIKLSNLVNGSVFTNQIKVKSEQVIDNTKGLVNYHGSVSPNNPADISEGTVFTVTIKALKTADSAVIGFDTDKTSTALSGNNVLGLTVGSILKIEK